jgi:hypothetical protein
MFGLHVPPPACDNGNLAGEADPSGGNLEPVGEGDHRERDGYYSPWRWEEACLEGSGVT